MSQLSEGEHVGRGITKFVIDHMWVKGNEEYMAEGLRRLTTTVCAARCHMEGCDISATPNALA